LEQLRDRRRSVKLRLLKIGRVARAKGSIDQDKLKAALRPVARCNKPSGGTAKRFSKDIAKGMKRATTVLKQLTLKGPRQELDEMGSLVRQVMKQTPAGIFRGNTRSEGKLLSLSEPSTEIIRKGKAGKPNEFGKMVKLQEAENQIVIYYQVYTRRPPDADLLVAAIETHQALLGTHRIWWRLMPHSSLPRTRPPQRQRASDASAFPIAQPKASNASASRKALVPQEMAHRITGAHQGGQTTARPRPLPPQGFIGMNRWVGLGIIADNLVNIGRAMEKRAAS